MVVFRHASKPTKKVYATMPIENLRKISGNASMIVPGVWLGDAVSAKSLDFHRKNRIDVVYNCTTSVKSSARANGGSRITTIRIPIEDSLKKEDTEKMKSALPYIVESMLKASLEKKNVLVHCYAGMQRSGIIVAAYIMRRYKLGMKEAIDFVISKRPIAFHGGKYINFIEALKHYETNLKKFKLL
jgi:atypical dual specificity phosphatase